jgi:SAP domain/LETM1-like protein
MLFSLQESEKTRIFDEQLQNMKVVQLKELCKERKLGTTGKKSDLISRLLDDLNKEMNNVDAPIESAPVLDDLDSMNVKDLKDACIVRALPGSGTKKQLLERLREDIQLAKNLQEVEQPSGRDGYVALSHLLEKMAPLPSVPKFVNVKITSLGLEPEKYTVGGAPSVTADVIRKLAGDPFADPPKYGTVS